MVMTGQAVGSFCSPSGCGWGCMCSMVKTAGKKSGAIETVLKNEKQKMQIQHSGSLGVGTEEFE